MHGNVCAGKLTDIDFNDVEKAIDVTAKILDPTEWRKVVEGAYLGFSIGGRYARKWAEVQNGKAVTRYTAVPSEMSIVDRPCIPTAKFHQISKGGFLLTKRDGTTERRQFCSSTNGGSSVDIFKVIHSRGPRRPEPLNKSDLQHDSRTTKLQVAANQLGTMLRKYGYEPIGGLGASGASRGAFIDGDAGLPAIKKALSFPPQSSNSTWNDEHADTGATNDWHDQTENGATVSHVGGFTDRAVGAGDPRISAAVSAAKTQRDAAVDAIKADWARQRRSP